MAIIHKEAPPYVIAGDSYESTFLIINKSNVKTEIRLEVESREGFPFYLEENKLTLDVGASKIIKVRVKTNKSIKHKDKTFVKSYRENYN